MNRPHYATPDVPTFDEGDPLLSGCVDALTIVIEREDDQRLRLARDLVLNVVLPPVTVILIGREELDR